MQSRLVENIVDDAEGRGYLTENEDVPRDRWLLSLLEFYTDVPWGLTKGTRYRYWCVSFLLSVGI
jgi:hypothetical protein